MSSSFRRLAFICWILLPSIMTIAQSLEAPGELEDGFKSKNWAIAGTYYSKLLQEGPSSKLYMDLGKLFMEESYPKHANFYFELAVSLDAQNAEVKEALRSSADRIAYLERRFHEFSEKAGKENDPTYYGRLSAIRFYMGDRREGLEILRSALQNYDNDARLLPLAGVFQKQLQFEGTSVKSMYQDFQTALEEQNVDLALNILGQINFLSIGHKQVVTLMEMAQKAFPGKINVESALLLTEFVKQFNQVDNAEGQEP